MGRKVPGREADGKPSKPLIREGLVWHIFERFFEPYIIYVHKSKLLVEKKLEGDFWLSGLTGESQPKRDVETRKSIHSAEAQQENSRPCNQKQDQSSST